MPNPLPPPSPAPQTCDKAMTGARKAGKQAHAYMEPSRRMAIAQRFMMLAGSGGGCWVRGKEAVEAGASQGGEINEAGEALAGISVEAAAPCDAACQGLVPARLRPGSHPSLSTPALTPVSLSSRDMV